ncbi:MAG TPA: hypothetical protein VFW65_07165 [Pseudonocardiaceae bacterium]|nr:hypothetical protein [Pseudonocardiaceae bacterium]
MTIRPRLPALLLAVAGALAIGGSFGTLEEEFERAGTATLTLTYSSWRLVQGGTYTETLYFHAPHFGIPLVVAGALAITAGVLLALDIGAMTKPLVVGAAGLLIGTVWTVGLVVSADVDAVTSGPGLTLAWNVGIGFWLVLGAGVVALAGGVTVLAGLVRVRRAGRRHVHPIGPPALPVFQPPVLSEPPDSA